VGPTVLTSDESIEVTIATEETAIALDPTASNIADESSISADLSDPTELIPGIESAPGTSTESPEATGVSPLAIMSNEDKPKPRVGGQGADNQYWTGGSGIVEKFIRKIPATTLAYRSTDLKAASINEAKIIAGLPKKQQLTLADASTETTNISLTSWISCVRSEIVDRGMDSVFRIEDRTLKTENYMLANWGTVKHSSVSKWVEVLKNDGCLFDQFNLSRSGKFLKNSISIELWDRIRTEVPEEEPSGPEVFTAIILSHQVTSSTVVQSLVEDLKTLRIRKIPGENVETLAKLVLDKAQRITGTGKQPDNFNMIIATCFLDSHSKQFEALANELHNKADDDDTEMDWKRDIVHPLRKKYISLKAQGLWPTTSVQSSEIQGLHVMIQALEAKLEGAESHASSLTSNNKPTCWKCGESGHTQFNCPKSEGNNSSSLSKIPATFAGVKVPPKNGESHTRTRDGTVEKWCRRCRRWTKGNKAHLTEEHVSNKTKNETNAKIGVTETETGTDYEEQSFMTTRLYKATTCHAANSRDELTWCEDCDGFKLKSHTCIDCNHPKGFAGQY
jgi:hypothetical protein